jgi:hypothetical protein
VNGTNRKRIADWWDYVLRTKNWKKLREYGEYRQKNYFKSKFDEYKKIHDSDKRMKEFGLRRQKRLLQNVYGLSYSLSTLSNYSNQIKLNADKRID